MRTHEMHAIAEFGVAAHFLYKDTHKHDTVLTSRQMGWIQQLQDSVQQYQSPDKQDKFKDKLAIELLDNNIFVYTPK